jgi:glycosyltransferase involved in cell wall biosynthesis
VPLVRVVIPTHNRSRLLGEAVQTVLDQSFGDFEIVIADDGSVDDTHSVATGLVQRDRRIRYVFHSNRGCAATRNAAIKMPGSFKYVALLDDDDLWLPEHLETTVRVLEEEPEITLVFARVRTIDELGGQWSAARIAERDQKMRRPIALLEREGPKGSIILDRDAVFHSLLRSEFTPHTSTVVVRAEQIPFDPWLNESLVVLEDLEFFVKLAKHSLRFAFIDAIHAEVRYQGDNLTRWIGVASPTQLDRMRSVLAHFESRLALCQDGVDRKIVRRDIAGSAYLVAHCLAEQCLLKEARRFYWKSGRHHLSVETVRGLVSACLPVGAFRVLREVRQSVSRALSSGLR